MAELAFGLVLPWLHAKPFAKQLIEEEGPLGENSRILSPTVYVASGSEAQLNDLVNRNHSLLMDWLAEDASPVVVGTVELKVKGFSLGVLSNIKAPEGKYADAENPIWSLFESFVDLDDIGTLKRRRTTMS